VERITFEEFMENSPPGKYDGLENVVMTARQEYSNLYDPIEFYRLENGEFHIQLRPKFRETLEEIIQKNPDFVSEFTHIFEMFMKWDIK